MKKRNVLLQVLALALIFTGTGNQAIAQKGEAYEVGLSMYSLRQLFEARGGSLDALDYPKFAKETFGITQIDVWDGGFPANKRNDPNFYHELKKRADAVGANIFLLMTGHVDSQTKDVEAHAQKFKAQVDFAKILDAKYVRVFLSAPKSVDRSLSLKNAAAALKPIADYAQSQGRIIVIEPKPNHYSGSGLYLAELAKAMDHPSLRLMPDFGKMKLDDPYGGTIAMMPYAGGVSAKSHEFDAEGFSKEFDYPRLMKSVIDSGFTGIVSIEYEGKGLGPVEGVKATQALLQRLNKRCAGTCPAKK